MRLPSRLALYVRRGFAEPRPQLYSSVTSESLLISLRKNLAKLSEEHQQTVLSAAVEVTRDVAALAQLCSSPRPSPSSKQITSTARREHIERQVNSALARVQQVRKGPLLTAIRTAMQARKAKQAALGTHSCRGCETSGPAVVATAAPAVASLSSEVSSSAQAAASPTCSPCPADCTCDSCFPRAVVDHCGGPNVTDSSHNSTHSHYYYQVLMLSNRLAWIPEPQLRSHLGLILSYWNQQERMHARRGRIAPRDAEAPRSYSPSRVCEGGENGDRFAAHCRAQQARLQEVLDEEEEVETVARTRRYSDVNDEEESLMQETIDVLSNDSLFNTGGSLPPLPSSSSSSSSTSSSLSQLNRLQRVVTAVSPSVRNTLRNINPDYRSFDELALTFGYKTMSKETLKSMLKELRVKGYFNAELPAVFPRLSFSTRTWLY